MPEWFGQCCSVRALSYSQKSGNKAKCTFRAHAYVHGGARACLFMYVRVHMRVHGRTCVTCVYVRRHVRARGCVCACVRARVRAHAGAHVIIGVVLGGIKVGKKLKKKTIFFFTAAATAAATNLQVMVILQAYIIMPGCYWGLLHAKWQWNHTKK